MSGSTRAMLGDAIRLAWHRGAPVIGQRASSRRNSQQRGCAQSMVEGAAGKPVQSSRRRRGKRLDDERAGAVRRRRPARRQLRKFCNQAIEHNAARTRRSCHRTGANQQVEGDGAPSIRHGRAR